MSDGTKIEWTEASWNPIRARNIETGGIGHFCVHKSPGCKNCYAEGFQPRFNNPIRFAAQERGKVEIFLDEKVLSQPLRWRKPRMIFVCSMTDLFGEFVTDEMLDRIFAVMALCPQHTFQCLTKRSGRMRAYCDRITSASGAGAVADAMTQIVGSTGAGNNFLLRQADLSHLPNVWLGVSVEDQARADERIPDLLATPAAVRWLSCEPLLAEVDLAHVEYYPGFLLNALTGKEQGGHAPDLPGLDWIVAGGESGRKARGSTDEVEGWMRSLRDQCASAGIPFFGKQNYRKLPLPDDLLVRVYPVPQVIR